jgi:hypothetical protein
MMFTVRGYFEDGRFFPYENAEIPERRDVILVVLDEEHGKAHPQNARAGARDESLNAPQSIDDENPFGFTGDSDS